MCTNPYVPALFVKYFIREMYIQDFPILALQDDIVEREDNFEWSFRIDYRVIESNGFMFYSPLMLIYMFR